MKTARTISVLSMLFISLIANAQDYKIHFSISGVVNDLDSVNVYNLDRGNSLTLSGKDTLFLLGDWIGIKEEADHQSSINVYPNPISEGQGVLAYYQRHSGTVLVQVFSADGKILLAEEFKVQEGRVEFQLSGMPLGMLMVRVQSASYSEVARLVCLGSGRGKPQINVKKEAHMFKNQSVESNMLTLSRGYACLPMLYNDGELLRFTAYAAGYKVVNELMPTGSQGLHFQFDFIYPAGYVHCDSLNPTAVHDIVNPITGKTWMDRNLGALQQANAIDDTAAYGELFQWGRFADGHQCRTSPTTKVLASTAVPNTGRPWDGKHIRSVEYPFDWLTYRDTSLWQGVDGTNNPCPNGYRLPTITELDNEQQCWSTSNMSGAFNSPLRLPAGGSRSNTGWIQNVATLAVYRSSTIDLSYLRSRCMLVSVSFLTFDQCYRARGASVRCIKD